MAQDIHDSVDDRIQDRLAELARQLQDIAKGGMDAFSALLSALEDIIPMLLHVQLLLFPPSPAPKPTASSSDRAQSEITPARAGPGNSTATAKPSTSTDQSSDITYTWENTCVFNVSRKSNLAVEPDHPWPLTGSAAFCCAMVTRSVLRTSNYNLLVMAWVRAGAGVQGPHFVDWQQLSTTGACSMAARLKYTSRHMEVERLVQRILTPLAAELSVQQGRFKRVKNACGEDVLCLDESRGLRGAQAAATSSIHVWTDPSTISTDVNCTVDRYLTAFVMQLLENFKRDDMAGEQEEGIDAPLLPDAPTGAAPEADGAGRPVVAAAAAAAATSAAASSPQVDGKGTVRMMGVRIQEPVVVDSMASRSGRSQPSTRRGRSPDMVDQWVCHDWSDFMFNLISMCIVYAYFSKAAGPHESITAVLLCMAVAAFDILLLLLRWLWYDHYLNYGLVLCVLHVYRVFLLPFANTWMLWSLVNKLEFEMTLSMWLSQALLLGSCYLFSVRVRSLLRVPVQLVTVCFSSSTAARCCGGPNNSGGFALACLCGVMWLQIVLGIIVPGLIIHRLEMSSCRSFVPHVQAKRSAFQT